MKMGTKSLLVGAHQFVVHPICLFVAWWKLYGFPFDPRLWVVFALHDIGYWGHSEMDSLEAESHPELGAQIIAKLFGEAWGEFSLLHSRFYAKRLNMNISRLCVADKFAVTLESRWFYLVRAKASGELTEYMRLAREALQGAGKYAGERPVEFDSPEQWFDGLRTWTIEWAHKNKNAATPQPMMWARKGVTT